MKEVRSPRVPLGAKRVEPGGTGPPGGTVTKCMLFFMFIMTFMAS